MYSLISAGPTKTVCLGRILKLTISNLHRFVVFFSQVLLFVEVVSSLSYLGVFCESYLYPMDFTWAPLKYTKQALKGFSLVLHYAIETVASNEGISCLL